MTHTNRLSREKSPYLLQHQHNPVDWYPWGEEAFAAARSQDKPIFLSIGYSTCYWCHVMERDSFERDDVAQVLNRDFIPIKVDREERPDVDQIYMDAVVGLTGRGGWPMSVFLTPDLKPFWGGTFFYRPQFLQILQAIRSAWDRDRAQVDHSAAEISSALSASLAQSEGISTAIASYGAVDAEIFVAAAAEYQQRFDAEWGGFGGAPKFPPAVALSLLLRIYYTSGDAALREIVETTLDRMARGGLFDHLAGGFARYSTDERWLVPHFEKMLYDNALLAVAYLEGYQLLARPEFGAVARETLDFVLREMTSPEGGFFSALDAGEVGREGEYYVWAEGELARVLTPEQYSAVRRVYGVSAHGNFEHHTNVLAIPREVAWSERDGDLVRSARTALAAVRSGRVRPHLDDKLLAAWNGMMIVACAKGYQVLGDRRYLDAAYRAISVIESRLMQPTGLLRCYRDDHAGVSACLDDYAHLIEGLLALYSCDTDPRWIRHACALEAEARARLWDADEGGYLFSAAPELIVKRKEILDGATPAGNATMLSNLVVLESLTGRGEYHERAAALLALLMPYARRYPTGCARTLLACDLLLRGPTELALVWRGERGRAELASVRAALFAEFLPGVVWAAAEEGAEVGDVELLSDRSSGSSGFCGYLCRARVCQTPLQSAAEVISASRAATRSMSSYRAE